MGININLTPELEELIRSKVESGAYASASEMVGETLWLLTQQDRIREEKLASLRAEIQRGIDSGPSEPWDHEDFLRKAHQRRSDRLSRP